MKANKSPLMELGRVPTGLAPLDELLGGGIFLHRMAQFSGRFSCGKSTLAVCTLINAQRMGYDTCWLDVEGRFAYKYFEKMGLDLSKLDMEYGLAAEKYFDFIQTWCEKNEGVIVLDSVGALLTRGESEKENGPSIPEVPKMIPNFLKRMTNVLTTRNCAVIILNHEKVDFDGAIKVIGGRAVEHFMTQWIRLRRMTMKPIKKGVQQIGDTIEASMKKDENQYQKTELELIAGEGFRGFAQTDQTVTIAPKKRVGRPPKVAPII